jgi:SAM-dependent methyltransferase
VGDATAIAESKQRRPQVAPRGLARALVRRVASTRLGERLLDAALADDAILARTLNTLSDRVAGESDLRRLAPRRPEPPDDLAACTWLFTPTVVGHGCARLMIDEGAYLWRLVRSLDRPFVTEIGRYHGGTSFLLAAAGGQVLSLDVDPALAEHDRALLEVLDAAGLGGRVDVRVADSRTFEVEPGSVDVVFVDGDHSYDAARADVEHWWPAVRAGGHLVMHDGKRPAGRRPWASPWKIEGSCRVADELRARVDADEVDAPGTLVHVVKRQ